MKIVLAQPRVGHGFRDLYKETESPTAFCIIFVLPGDVACVVMALGSTGGHLPIVTDFSFLGFLIGKRTEGFTFNAAFARPLGLRRT